MKLLAEKGIQATPMSVIAKAANTGMGTIYNYFATKEELINAIYLYIKHAELHLINKRLDSTASVKSRFFHYYTSFIDFYLKYPDSFVFMDQFQNSPVITQQTKDAGKEGFLPIIILLQQGQDQEIIKQIEMNALLQFLAGSITTYVRWVFSNAKKKHSSLLEPQLRMVWDAIKA